MAWWKLNISLCPINCKDIIKNWSVKARNLGTTGFEKYVIPYHATKLYRKSKQWFLIVDWLMLILKSLGYSARTYDLGKQLQMIEGGDNLVSWILIVLKQKQENWIGNISCNRFLGTLYFAIWGYFKLQMGKLIWVESLKMELQNSS